MLVAVKEVVAPLWSEFIMFALAAFLYLMFSRSVKVRGPTGTSKKAKKLQEEQAPEYRETSIPPTSSLRETRHKAPHGQSKPLTKELEEVPQAYMPIFQMSKAGDSSGVMHAMAQLPKELLAALPPRVATKVILCLGKSETLSEEVMQQFMRLASSFDSQIFESAMAEASRWRSIPACRQLYNLARAASVQKSERMLTLLVRGHMNDSAAMRQMVEDLLADGSGVQLTRTLASSLMAHCTSAGDLVTSKIIQEQAQKRNMAQEQGLVDVISYDTMMKAKGNSVAARKLGEMVERGIMPSQASYHNLLNAMVQRGDCKGALALVDEMTVSGTGVSAITWSILLKSTRRRSQSQEELSQILQGIRRSDVCMDESLFASVVESCVRSGSLKLLWDQLEWLWSRHDAAVVAISSPSYGSMIKAYGQAGDVQTVKHLWSKHRQDTVQLTSITLGCMVEALVANGLSQDAWATVGELWEDPEQRTLVNTVTYSTIVKGFAMSRQHDLVLAVYKEMKDRQIDCNSITYNTMINALARCNLMHEVPQLLEDMKASCPPVKPDIVTFSTIIKGYCMSGDLDKALEVLVHMRSTTSLQPDEVLYNSLLNGCAKQSRLDEALGFLTEMKESQVPPSNYTLSIICKLFGRMRRLEQAFSTVESLSNSNGFRPNIEVYTSLMQACFHNRQYQRALSLHDQIVAEGSCCPDEKTYNVIVRGCLHSKAIDKAVEVVRCAFHLPGHRMQRTQGRPQGIAMACLDEVMAELGHTSAQGRALITDLKNHRGITVSEVLAMSSHACRQGPYGGRRP